jgi:hypothetical protein
MEETRERPCKATASALIGIGPKDEIEGMIAAHLLAAHSDGMLSARHGEQTLEGGREKLSQANKLSRSYALLLDALNRQRGKGHQKVTVEKISRATLRPSFGLPELLVVIRTSRLASTDAAKSLLSTAVSESSGNVG